MTLHEQIRVKWDSHLMRQSWIHERSDELEISMLVLYPSSRGRGIGAQIMRDIVAYADRTRKRILLTPSPIDGSSKAGLVRFYKTFGFVENKGRRKNFEFRATMYRDPR